MAETDKTRTELVREAANRLNIVGTGQILEAEYADRIDANVDPLFQQLTADGICNTVDDNHLPAEWFDSLVGLLANTCASIAGVSYSPDIKTFYEANLKRLTSSRPSYSVLEAEYF